MTSPTAIPRLSGSVTVRDTERTFYAMASQVSVRISAGAIDPGTAARAVEDVFRAVERECSRFDSASDLMRANAVGDSWCAVGPYCYQAISEAASAHEWTDHLFDPRVLRTLLELGYDRTLAFAGGPIRTPEAPLGPHPVDRSPWRPGLDATLHAVRIGVDPIDLGGIGKGLALRWAARRIATDCPSFLIEAGGDCYLAGGGPVGKGWQIAIEDPAGSAEPIAVLSGSDLACATSSIRIRQWTAGNSPVHHLIDPRRGRPSSSGLQSVTVLHADPAVAEVWSKVLFVKGKSEIATGAAEQGLAAVWIDEDGNVGLSRLAEQFVIWTAP